jgi:hypothetical protein
MNFTMPGWSRPWTTFDFPLETGVGLLGGAVQDFQGVGRAGWVVAPPDPVDFRLTAGTDLIFELPAQTFENGLHLRHAVPGMPRPEEVFTASSTLPKPGSALQGRHIRAEAGRLCPGLGWRPRQSNRSSGTRRRVCDGVAGLGTRRSCPPVPHQLRKGKRAREQSPEWLHQ